MHWGTQDITPRPQLLRECWMHRCRWLLPMLLLPCCCVAGLLLALKSASCCTLCYNRGVQARHGTSLALMRPLLQFPNGLYTVLVC